MDKPKSKRGGARPGAGRKPKAASQSQAPKPARKAAAEPSLPEPRSPGRQSDFRSEYVEQARKLCLLGATDLEIADFFGVTVRTIYRWKGEREEFCQALKVGKAEADERVERSLFARANGYEHDEVDIRVVNGQIVQTPIRKFYPPDTVAAIFWLKNRRRDVWRDKIDHEHSGSIELANTSDEQLDAQIKERAQRLGLTLQ